VLKSTKCQCGVKHPVEVLGEGPVVMLMVVCPTTGNAAAVPAATESLNCQHARCRSRIKASLKAATRLAGPHGKRA
jgi:hypothetical protein